MSPLPLPHQKSVSKVTEHSTVDATGALASAPSTITTPVTVKMHDDLPVIAGYVITSELARGGMGRVLAGRELLLDREVAIKILLPGSDATRFVTEARITARLPHPSIPAVYALGQLSDASPFLSMKLIRGSTLYQELQARTHLSDDLPRFLQIFEQIAQAVGFAHAQNIIHRDLKPANVMVGAFGEVQVMDWGLAKELGTAHVEDASIAKASPEETAQSSETVAWAGETPGQHGEQTRSGAVLGTPNYMAPEQARGEPATARSDVFALGGILFSILTGKTVFGGASVIETIRQAAAGDTAGALAKLDATGTDSEITAIARQCLSVVSNERPADGRAVAKLIEEYRHGVAERLKRAETAQAEALVREAEQRKRRRLAQIAAGSVLTVLLAGIIGTSIGLWQATEAAEAERKANNTAQEEKGNALRAMESEKKAKLTAQHAQKQEAQEKAVALAVREFLQERILRRVNPWELINLEQQSRPRVKHDMTVRELLDLAAQEFQPSRIESKFPQQPLVQAEVLETIGETYEGIGDAAKAISYVKAAHQLRESHLGTEHPRTLASLTNLAFMHLANADQKEALTLASDIVFRLETCLQRTTPSSNDGEQTPDAAGEAIDAVHRMIERRADPRRYSLPTVSIGVTEGAMMLMQLMQGLPRVQRVADMYAQRFGKEDRRTMMVRLLVGFAHHAMGRVREACNTYEAVLAYAEKHMDPDDFLVSGLRQVLIITYDTLGIKADERLRLQQHLAISHERILGPDHPETLEIKLSLASSYRKSGNTSEEMALQKKVCDTFTTMLGKEHPRTLQLLLNLGESLERNGKETEAVAMIQEVFDIAQRKLGAQHTVSMNAQHNLAGMYRKTGKVKEAIQLFEQLYDDSVKRLGKEHSDTLMTMYGLAEAYQDGKRFNEAITLLDQLHKTEVVKRGKDHRDTLLTLRKLAKTHHEQGNYPQAITHYEQLVELQSKKEGKEHPETLISLYQFAESHRSAKHYEKANSLFDQVYTARTRVLGADDPKTLDALYCLALTNRQLKQYPLALERFNRALDIELKKYGLNDSRTLMTHFGIALTYLEMGNIEKAMPMLEENLKLRKTVLGIDHPDTLITMQNLANGVMRTGMPDKATQIYEEIRTLKIKKLGLEHPSTITTISSLAIAYRNTKRLPEALIHFEQAASLVEKLNYKHDNVERIVPYAYRAYEEARQYDKAEAWRRKWLPIVKAKSGEQSLTYAEELGGLGVNLVHQKKGKDAEPLLREALSKLQKQAPDDWFTSQTQFALGCALLMQKQYAEAEPLLLQGYTGLKQRQKTIPVDRNTLKEAPMHLIEFYTATNKPEEVKRWQAEMEKK